MKWTAGGMMLSMGALFLVAFYAAYLKLGNIKLRRQEREEAVRCWERALELDPDNAIVRTNLESVRQVF